MGEPGWFDPWPSSPKPRLLSCSHRTPRHLLSRRLRLMQSACPKRLEPGRCRRRMRPTDGGRNRSSHHA
uniref:Uncharacterized protein n=1 Tax=Paenarthrobacter nicotinovorans TaxID=29320 RepID=Q8GAF5_PAENI|nr:hypothetical protein [Paenarthrobacter nicotinovorans]